MTREQLLVAGWWALQGLNDEQLRGVLIGLHELAGDALDQSLNPDQPPVLRVVKTPRKPA